MLLNVFYDKKNEINFDGIDFYMPFVFLQFLFVLVIYQVAGKSNF
jgi:hypothetical protein